LCDKVYQLLAHGRWFPLGTPASSTTKTGRHDIGESGIKHQKSIINQTVGYGAHQSTLNYFPLNFFLFFSILYCSNIF
jgi:hypothetical protein